MTDYYLDTRNIREQFKMRVEWDIDYHFVEGCHATDLLTPDDEVEIPINVYKNSDIVVQWGWDLSVYVLKPNGQLFEARTRLTKYFPTSYRTDLRSTTKIPTAYYSGPCAEVGCVLAPVFSANDQFYACYLESPDLNRHLTQHQKTIVESFFAAVRNTFPQQFASK